MGILFQVVGDFQIERSFSGNNGFNISNMRLILSGELDEGFGYLFNTNFTSSLSILDAKAYYGISPAFTVDVGLFKAPFSKEYLTGAGAIDFVNRAQVVSALAVKRQIGVQVHGGLHENTLSYSAGIFNGNGYADNNNDNNRFMYAGRIMVIPKLGQGDGDACRLEIGLNSAFSEDKNISVVGGALPQFTGERILLGGDISWVYKNISLSAEAIYARLKYDDTTGRHTKDPYGYHATAGYMIADNSQILVRWDSFIPDGISDNSDLIIFGYNLWPTKVIELQANYIIPAKSGNFKHHQILINTQLAF